MVSIALKISDELKVLIDKLPWINWSEIAREEILSQESVTETFERFKKLISKSILTEEDARALAKKIDEGMLKELRKRHRGL